jgi:hypothetical protein
MALFTLAIGGKRQLSSDRFLQRSCRSLLTVALRSL